MPWFAPGYSPWDIAQKQAQTDLLKQEAEQRRLSLENEKLAGQRLLGINPQDIMSEQTQAPIPAQDFNVPSAPTISGPLATDVQGAADFQPAPIREDAGVGSVGLPAQAEQRRPRTPSEATLELSRYLGPAMNTAGGRAILSAMERAMEKEASLAQSKATVRSAGLPKAFYGEKSQMIFSHNPMTDTIKVFQQGQDPSTAPEIKTVDQAAGLLALGKIDQAIYDDFVKARDQAHSGEVMARPKEGLITKSGKEILPPVPDTPGGGDLNTTAKARAFVATESKKPLAEQNVSQLAAAREIVQEAEASATRVQAAGAAVRTQEAIKKIEQTPLVSLPASVGSRLVDEKGQRVDPGGLTVGDLDKRHVRVLDPKASAAIDAADVVETNLKELDTLLKELGVPGMKTALSLWWKTNNPLDKDNAKARRVFTLAQQMAPQIRRAFGDDRISENDQRIGQGAAGAYEGFSGMIQAGKVSGKGVMGQVDELRGALLRTRTTLSRQGAKRLDSNSAGSMTAPGQVIHSFGGIQIEKVDD